MSSSKIDSLMHDWARLGLRIGIEMTPLGQHVDIERLLLETVRSASTDARLFTAAATWLSRYSRFVDVFRLANLIEGDLEPEHRPTMGLLLEWAQQTSSKQGLGPAVVACGEAIDCKPLFDVAISDPAMRLVVESESSVLARRWGRLMSPTRLRTNALRSENWILQHNPWLKQHS